MPLKLFRTKGTEIIEKCVWVKDGSRFICMTYNYSPAYGKLTYASSVLKSVAESPTTQQRKNHEYTTTRRYDIRPVYINIKRQLNGIDVIKAIRYQMCLGIGCVGPRKHNIIEEYVILDTDCNYVDDVECVNCYSDNPTCLGLQKTYGDECGGRCLNCEYVQRQHI